MNIVTGFLFLLMISENLVCFLAQFQLEIVFYPTICSPELRSVIVGNYTMILIFPKIN